MGESGLAAFRDALVVELGPSRPELRDRVARLAPVDAAGPDRDEQVALVAADWLLRRWTVPWLGMWGRILERPRLEPLRAVEPIRTRGDLERVREALEWAWSELYFSMEDAVGWCRGILPDPATVELVDGAVVRWDQRVRRACAPVVRALEIGLADERIIEMSVRGVEIASHVAAHTAVDAMVREWMRGAWVDAACAVDPTMRWEPAARRPSAPSSRLWELDDERRALFDDAPPEAQAAALAVLVAGSERRADAASEAMFREVQDSAVLCLECMVALAPGGASARDAELLRVVVASQAVGGLRADRAWRVVADALLDRDDPRGEAIALLLRIGHRVERGGLGRSVVFDWHVADGNLRPRERERLVDLAAQFGAAGRRPGGLLFSVPFHPR